MERTTSQQRALIPKPPEKKKVKRPKGDLEGKKKEVKEKKPIAKERDKFIETLEKTSPHTDEFKQEVGDLISKYQDLLVTLKQNKMPTKSLDKAFFSKLSKFIIEGYIKAEGRKRGADGKLKAISGNPTNINNWVRKSF